MTDRTAPTIKARGISPRALTIALLAIFLAGVALGAWWYFRDRAPDADGPVTFANFDPESTATVSFAGQFPPATAPPLARPLGMAGDGETLYVALGQAGAIATFDYDGSRIGTIALEPAKDITVSSPIDVALLPDGRLAVIDAAAPRVVLLDPEDPEAAPEPFGPTEGDNVLVMPTAIAVADDAVFVADSSDHSVREYLPGGDFRRRIEFAKPGLTFVGGLLATPDTLFVSDSNAERVVIVDRESGAQTRTFGRRLALPRDLALGDDGTIWVAETFGRQVSQFDPTGQTLVEAIGDQSAEDLESGGMPGAPESVVWDAPSSRLYVTDTIAGRVYVYNVRQEVIE